MNRISLLLGVPNRRPIKTRLVTAKPIAHSEGDGVFKSPISPTGHPVTYYANAHIFSGHTERDEIQPVGRLYKGVDEYD